MSGVRRRGYFAAAVALLGAALVTALMAAPPDKPVDIRLVAPPPLPAETITASATTTVSAVGPVPVTTAPPPPPVVARPLPRQSATPTKPPSTTSSRRSILDDLLRCDYKYFDDFERCVPWPLTDEELCKFLKDHHLKPIEVRDRDGRGLGLDCDD